MENIVPKGNKSQVDFYFQEKISKAFTAGDCWVLAKSIEAIAGYPIVTASFGHGYWFHVANQLPDGRVVDIMGIKPANEWFDFWVGVYGMQGRNEHFVQWTTEDFNIDFAKDPLKPNYPEISDQVQSYAEQVVAIAQFKMGPVP